MDENYHKCALCNAEDILSYDFYYHSLVCSIKFACKFRVDYKLAINQTFADLGIDICVQDSNKINYDTNKRLRSDIAFESVSSHHSTYNVNNNNNSNNNNIVQSPPIVPAQQFPQPPQTLSQTNWRAVLNHHCGGVTCIGSRCTQKVASSNGTNFSLVIENGTVRYPIQFCESGRHFKDIDQVSRFQCILQEAFILAGVNNFSNIDNTSENRCFHGVEKRGACDNLVGTSFYLESTYHRVRYYYCKPSCALKHLGNISTTKWRKMHKSQGSTQNDGDIAEMDAEIESSDNESNDNSDNINSGDDDERVDGSQVSDSTTTRGGRGGGRGGENFWPQKKKKMKRFEKKLKLIIK